MFPGPLCRAKPFRRVAPHTPGMLEGCFRATAPVTAENDAQAVSPKTPTPPGTVRSTDQSGVGGILC